MKNLLFLSIVFVFSSFSSLNAQSVGCLVACNYTQNNCSQGTGLNGESREDFKKYFDCRCPNGVGSIFQNPNCTWWGSNTNNPSSLSCSELSQVYITWTTECTIGYTICANSCSAGPGNQGTDGQGPKPRTKLDCDGDGIPNAIDPSPGC